MKLFLFLLGIFLFSSCVTSFYEEGSRVVREHGHLRGLERMTRDEFANDPLNRVLLSSSNLGLLSPDPSPISSSRGAWLTHLTNDYFIPGARALGHSIKRTKTHFALVLLYTDGLSEKGLQTLKDDGVWTLKHVSNLKNPNADHYMFQERLKNVYTKCHIYNQTEYDKIVYIDSDIIFLENSDELFQCPGYCASFRHSFFNTGVIVARPSTKFFNDLLEKFPKLPSYNGGEQGLMNAYLWDFDMKCPLFHNDPQTMSSFIQNKITCGRLPSYYNGDIGPYYLHDASWWLPEQRNSPKILHYTLGSFKPWEWLWYPVFDICWIWYEMYTDIPGVSGSVFDQLMNLWVFLAVLSPPACLVLMLVFPAFLSSVKNAIDAFLEVIVKALLHSEGLVGLLSAVLGHQSSILLPTISLLGTLGTVASIVFFSIFSVNYVAGIEVLHPGLCLFMAVQFVIVDVSLFIYVYYRGMYLLGSRLSHVLPRIGYKSDKQPSQSDDAKKPLMYTFGVLGALFLCLTFLATYSIHPDWYTLHSKIRTAIIAAIFMVYLLCVMSLHLPFEWLRQGFGGSHK